MITAVHSLRIKFAFLLGAFGVVVLLNAATTLWGVLFLERQFDRPMRATEKAMALLGTVKRRVGAQHGLLAGDTEATAAIGPVTKPEPADRSQDRERLEELSREASEAVRQLREADDLQLVLGSGAPYYLGERLAAAAAELDLWLRTGDEAARARTMKQLFDMHEDIEKTEAEIIKNASRASAHANEMRRPVMASLAASVGIAFLAGLLSVQLVRRWVLAPVEQLRQAAERFGAGQLDHVVRVQGKDEIATLAAEFNSMTRTIEAMQVERIERERLAAFGAVTRRIVHNIKSPLGGIRMMAELASDEVSQSETREKLQRIIGTVDRFNVWLRRLLDVTRPAEICPTPVSPARWLEEVMAPLEARAHGAGVHLALDASQAPEEANFDPAHLEQAVVAMVSNAIEATPAGGSVTVRVWIENNNGWGLDVQDGGPGVPERMAAEVFQPYFTTKSGGSGIGLAMARKVARDHGGDAWLRDAGEGRGATFTIALPRRPRAQSASNGQSEA